VKCKDSLGWLQVLYAAKSFCVRDWSMARQRRFQAERKNLVRQRGRRLCFDRLKLVESVEAR
jgi:hypothetical protein